MLDVRPTAYIVPIAEQEFASLTPQVLIVNSGTVGALVNGHCHIYRLSTGLRLYTSELAISTIPAGTSLAVSALTPWSPPAPADDDYFIMCDITATATSPHEPPGIVTQLGPYSFDIKPVGMGPAPAAHGVTHQDGGSDELDVTGLEGLLADPQTPLGHHTSHELGGSDEVDVTGLPGSGSGNIEDLTTAEMDDALVLAPDGAGGVEFRAEVGGITDHGALSGLTDDDHTQYRLRHEIYFETDFLYRASTNSVNNFPWFSLAISSGSEQPGTGTSVHPGLTRLVSSVNANSGFYIILSTGSILLAGSCKSICCHRPVTLAGTTRHHGFHDATSVTDPVDGAWIWQNPATGIIYGRTMKNSAGSTTGTGYQLVTNTWYTEVIVVNSDASRVDFYIYNDAGALLWTDNLTTNIPTAAGRELGHGIVVTNSGTTAAVLDEVDFLRITLPNRRPNV
jgi:hypothetical protein